MDENNTGFNFEWVDAEKFIPEKNGFYLTVRTDKDGKPRLDVCEWFSKLRIFAMQDGAKPIYPTHWAKLPEPPDGPTSEEKPTMTEEAEETRREYMREYQKKNRDKINAAQRKYNAAHPEKRKEWNARYWNKKSKRSKSEA